MPSFSDLPDEMKAEMAAEIRASTTGKRRARPKLSLVPPIPRSSDTTATTATTLSCTLDVVSLLGNPDHYKTYAVVGRFDKSQHATAKLDPYPYIILNSITSILQDAQKAGITLTQHTVANTLLHLGLLEIRDRPETERLREAEKKVDCALKSLRRWQESPVTHVRDKLPFGLMPGAPNGRAVTMTHGVDSALTALANSLGVSKGMLAACAMMETLRHQAQYKHLSDDNAPLIEGQAVAFLGWLNLKAGVLEVMVRLCLSEEKGEVSTPCY